jgi:CheY-like chemotaxis protein
VLSVEAAASFSDIVDGVVKLGALVVVVYAVFQLLPTMRQRGFTASIFGNEVSLHGPTEAVETLSGTFEKQIDDLRTQLTALQARRADPDDGQPAPRTAVTREFAHPRGARTVLWVDDNPANNLFEMGKLREAGFLVRQVGSTDEAVAALEEKHDEFDLLITDMHRKEGGDERAEAGIQLIEWLRRFEGNKQLPEIPAIVYCSAWAVRTFGSKALARGATGVTASTTELLTMVLGDEKRREGGWADETAQGVAEPVRPAH